MGGDSLGAGSGVALEGPDGGVPGPVLEMLTEIGSADRAEAWVRNEMAQGRRIMGFGHRVYKVRDPRAALLSGAAEKMARATSDRSLLELTQAVERTTVRVLAINLPHRFRIRQRLMEAGLFPV